LKFDVTAELAVRAAGAVIVALLVDVQPFTSFVVSVYAPAPRPVNTFDVWKLTPFLEYCNAPVPPCAVTVICPSEAVLQLSWDPLKFDVTAELDVTAAGAVIVALLVCVQPFASFVVSVYAPAARPVNTFDVWKFTPFFEYVSDPVPPEAVTVICPSDVPLQLS
jgi:hypothetical protein